MAAVELDRLWINDATDPSQYLAFRYGTLDDTPAVAVEVRAYAGGVRRAIRRPGRSRVVQATIFRVGTVEREWLIARLGRTVCLRDARGRKMFGVYGEVPQSDVPGVGYAHATLTVTETSWVEGV